MQFKFEVYDRYFDIEILKLMYDYLRVLYNSDMICED